MRHNLRSISLLWTIWVASVFTGFSQNPPLPFTNPTDCQLWQSIEDAGCDNPHQFELQINSAPGNSLGVNVYLEKVKLLISHNWLADVEVRLISPSGKTVELIDEVGSGNKNFGDPNTTDCSSVTTVVSHNYDINCGVEGIDDATWPYLGEYLPIGNFSEFNDGSNPIGNWVLEICDDAIPDTGSLLFVELIFAPSDCLQPTDLQLVDVDSNSANINWMPGAFDCSSTIIEYGPPGFEPGTGIGNGEGTVVFGGCPPFLLTGLFPSSVYEVYIRQNCGGGSVSTNSCPIQFSTNCSPAPPSLVEDFNTQSLCSPYCGVACDINGLWSNSLVDDNGFDWIVHEDSTSTAGTGPQDDFPGGGKYIYIDYSVSGCSRGRFAALTSSCIDVFARPDTCDFSFDYHMFGVHVQSLSFQITLDGGENWIDLWSRSGNIGETWNRAYIDLDAYHGQTVQFRFLGEGGNAKKGDIALDNIIFYGSTASNAITYTYYEDNDGDGYGGQEVFYQACQNYNMNGFVPDNSDCNDLLFFINPGMAESPCDGYDLNCDPSDEFDLPAPLVSSDTVCSGEIGFVSALPSQFDGVIHWFATESDSVELGTGNDFSPQIFPENLTTSPITLTFFAEETSSDSCRSITRTEGHIVILPQPEISTLDTPSVCRGELYDLTTIDVIDATGANGVITYHDGFPASMANQIDPVVFPNGTETFYIASTPTGGCTDVVSVDFDIKPTPLAEIGGSDFICFNSTDNILIANDFGNAPPPVERLWFDGTTGPTASISPNPINGLSDNYTLTLTAENGCSHSDTLTVTTITSVDQLAISSQAVSTCLASDGSIMLNPQNGQSPFNYFWEGNGISGNEMNVAGAYTVDNLAQGAYSFTITDSSPEGCHFVFPIQTVDGPGAILTDSEITPVTCNGGADGCIEINVVGNSPSILWETGETTEEICGLPAGSYTVTITDDACETELTFIVSEPQKLVVSTTINDVKCHGENNGSIVLNTFNGNGGYQYEWQHGPLTSVVQSLSSGDYSVTITDSKGCFIEIPFLTVDEPDPIGFQLDVLGEPSCFGGNDGQITVTPTGGNAPFDVDWSNDGMGTTINSLLSGTYDISIDDANGCLFTDQINLPQPTPIQVILDNLEEPECNGIDNGTIEISTIGGNGGYDYEWNSGQTNEDLIAQLPPGTFWVTVTDAAGCTGISEPFVLNENPFIELEFEVSHPMCFGVDDGSICADVFSGGQAPFNYDWSIDESIQCLENLPPGDYTVTVTDGLGCQYDSTITLITDQAMTVEWFITDPACFGTASGQILMNVSDGTQPYTIEWSNAEFGNTIDSLPAGNYAATVTDANGCKFFTPLISLKEPPLLEVAVINVESVTCFGDEDGSIDVNVFGGTSPISLMWENNDTTASINGLAPGEYQLTATDAKGCVNEGVTVEVATPEIIEMSAQSASLGCTSFSTDTLCVSVQGGVLPFEFAWSNGHDDNCLINAPIGDYSITATDANGCTDVMMSVKVTDEIDVMTLQEVNVGQDSICAGEASGNVQVEVEGGVPPFQFIWNNGEFGTTSNTLFALENLNGGEYQITITDNFGCTKISNIIPITEADSIKINALGINQTPVNCFDGEDGAIDISVSGGFSPYQFIWQNESGIMVGDTEDLNGLGAGEYFVTVTDINLCESENSVMVNQPEGPLGFGQSEVEIEDETCFQDSDGQITVPADGGTAPYYFVWSTGDTTVGPTIDHLIPDEYFVTIVDANDCAYFSNAINVLGADTILHLVDYEIGHASCFGAEDAFINVTLDGGFGNYIYSWLPANENEDQIAIPAGIYDLTVWDEHLCQYDTFFEVFEPDELVLNFLATPATNGNDGSIICEPGGGLPPYICQLTTGETGDTIFNLEAGWHELLVIDANLCETSVWVEVPPGVSNSNEEMTQVSFSLYPNPTGGYSVLSIENEKLSSMNLKVYDTFGKMVLEKNTDHSREIILPIDLSLMPPGIYFVSGTDDEGQLFSTRLVLMGQNRP